MMLAVKVPSSRRSSNGLTGMFFVLKQNKKHYKSKTVKKEEKKNVMI